MATPYKVAIAMPATPNQIHKIATGLRLSVGVFLILKKGFCTKSFWKFPLLLMQYVAEDNSDKIGLCAVPWLDVVGVAAVEIFLVDNCEIDLTRRAAGQQEQGCQVT